MQSGSTGGQKRRLSITPRFAFMSAKCHSRRCRFNAVGACRSRRIYAADERTAILATSGTIDSISFIDDTAFAIINIIYWIRLLSAIYARIAIRAWQGLMTHHMLGEDADRRAVNYQAEHYMPLLMFARYRHFDFRR